MTVPIHLNMYMALRFVIFLLTHETAKLLSNRKENRIPVSEALKTEQNKPKIIIHTNLNSLL